MIQGRAEALPYMELFMRVFKIDQSNPAPAVVDQITELLKSGAVIAFPTDTYYGLGADIYNERALKKVFDIKGRGYDKPVLILISVKEELNALVSADHASTYACKLIDRLWPGPLTIVFKASASIPDILTGTTGKIGIRLPDHNFCRSLVAKLGRPVTATSANISGMPSLDNPAGVLKAIGDRIDALVDGGLTRGGSESTVVDVTGPEPVVLREDAIPASHIKKIMTV